MQQSNNLLSSEEIQLLEQNYINSDSAPFIEKISYIYQNYTTRDYEINALQVEFQTLYKEASKINPAALPYSNLTSLVFTDEENYTDGFISDLKEFITKQFEEKKQKNNLTIEDEKAISVLIKTTEHLSLALSQKNSLYIEQKLEFAKLEKKYIEINTALKETEQKYIKYKNKYDKMTIDFLSMMGIFSTIIFSVFGGLSQIGAIGDNLSETPISKILMYISLSAIILILIIFFSFNAISKLTGLKLKSCTCTENNCTCAVSHKHPTLYFSLFFFIDLFLFSLVLKALGNSNWILSVKDIFDFKNDGIIKFIIFILFLSFNVYVLIRKKNFLKFI
ncbi:hypothetical protein IGL01_002288 [Enterococcus sp. DIV0340]|uniref:hypothetical protein n=1 Tax=unclassified Enterococcus TaxID=2608891 RepID=UPI003D2FE6AA